MSIAKGLKRYWLEDSNIRAVIESRIYANRMPDAGKLPCIVLQVIDVNRRYHLVTEATVAEAIVQVDIYGTTTTQVNNLAEVMRHLTSAYRGAAGDVTVDVALIIREHETVEQPKDGSAHWIYRHSRDYQVFYIQAAPTFT